MSLTFMTLVFDDAAGSLVGTVSTVILGVALPGLKYAPLVVALVLVKLASIETWRKDKALYRIDQNLSLQHPVCRNVLLRVLLKIVRACLGNR